MSYRPPPRQPFSRDYHQRGPGSRRGGPPGQYGGHNDGPRSSMGRPGPGPPGQFRPPPDTRGQMSHGDGGFSNGDSWSQGGNQYQHDGGLRGRHRGPRFRPPGRDPVNGSQDGNRVRIPAQQRDAPSQELRLDRLARERVSRTLFIRNVAYEVDTAKFRSQFEQFGELKDWFDAIRRRGMVFVTYYDVSSAEAARLGMMGVKLYGRAIDVHFSLPKDHDHDGPCDESKNQGSLMVTLRPRRMLEERELGAAADACGRVKSIKTCGYQEKRIVEYFDSRAAVDFHNRMNGRPFLGGTLDVEYIWDVGEVVNHDVVIADAVHQATTARPLPSTESSSRRSSYSQPPGKPYDRPDDRQYGRAPIDQEYGRPPNDRDYGPPGPYDGPSRYSEAPPPPPVPAPDGRLDQARKVQDLLASLGNVASLNNEPSPTRPSPSYGPPSQNYGLPPTAPYHPPRPSMPPAHPPQGSQSYPPPTAYPPPGPPGPPPTNFSPTSSYPPPPPNYPPLPSNYPPPQTSHHPPPSNYPPPPSAHPPPPSNYPPPGNSYGRPPAGSPHAPSASIPAQVLAMLTPQQQAGGYGARPQQDGYDPNNSNGSLLTMLPRQ